jgi:hypothetical protein
MAVTASLKKINQVYGENLIFLNWGNYNKNIIKILPGPTALARGFRDDIPTCHAIFDTVRLSCFGALIFSLWWSWRKFVLFNSILLCATALPSSSFYTNKYASNLNVSPYMNAAHRFQAH